MIIHDVASKKIAPIVRALLAHELVRKGFSQRRVASLLGVTQPQIHKYLAEEVEDVYRRAEKLGLNTASVEHVVKILVSTITSGRLDKFVLMLNAFVDALTRSYVCREFSGVLNVYCVKKGFVDAYIEEYRFFLERIVGKRCIEKVIPEVGSNIVYSPADARDISEVIGLTGRLVKTKIGVDVVGEPMYGGSRHLARVLLMAREHNPVKKAAMNIVGFENALGLDRIYSVRFTGPHRGGGEFWASIAEALRSRPDILIDRGGVGLEPITYVFARDLAELEEIIDYVLSRICRG